MEDESVLERILNGIEEPNDLPLALLQRITNNFSPERKIGQGGFGAVYKGVLRNGIVVAVKRMYVNQHTLDDVSFRREFNSLRKINHQNVVRFLGFCSNTYQTSIEGAGSEEINLANVRERLLCFEYISNGSLDKHITDELRGLEWETRYEIIIGICKGLCYLHEEKEIVHMDLKPANILLDGTYIVPKITDFGLSRSNKNTHTMGLRFGTRGYLAPEYENAGKTSFKSDIYSMGAIIIELVTGCMDVPDKNNVLRRWRHRWNKPPTLLQYQQVTRCIDIAIRCRQQVPEARPSILEIISFLSKSESTDMHTGQIIRCYDEDDMLGIKPLELRLPSELKKEISGLVVLTNGTRNCIAFNIQLPSGQLYSAQPYKGIVQPKSKYGMKIIVKPGDVHEHDQANKFIVQSMKVSEGLRDEDIEGCMFEEASKVVDKVNLMVVYESTKPQENCKSREDTNMPAEEVPEAKRRKIVGSASENSKLGSSKNAEATFMDANSSVRGQCTEQTEQFNLHPLQSFSRHYPTNMRYLEKENDRAVDLPTGALGSLLDKLGKLLEEDYNLEDSIKTDIKSFSEKLMKMHQTLRNLGKFDGVKIWTDQVRKLSYHIEDMVDTFLVHVEPNSNRGGFRELTHKGLKLWENGMTTHHQIGDVIRHIKNKVQAVADMQENYDFNVNNVVANVTAKLDTDLRISAIYVNKERLIGIKARRDELIRLFEEDGDASTLKTVSIVGMGGLGKTTLAKAVYDKLKKDYHHRAFIPVGQNPDVKKVLNNILFEFGQSLANFDLDVHQLINELRKLLKKERYFIVIDDIWDSEAWGFIQSAFPGNKHGSRVITTTRIEVVARACCEHEGKYVYRMKSLSEEHSRRLFFRRIFGPEKDCPDTPRKEEISKYILKKCDGMPLAINSIASLLAGEQESTWEYIWKSLGSVTEEDDLEKMNRILDLSYIHLPDHLKTCLLYVCMYPEDREIDKNDLLKQWVAEGFVHVSRNSGLDAQDVAEKYFKELISMCMIQPGRIDDYNNEVLSCRVHDIILDLLRSKSSKENFVHVIDGSKDTSGEIHRVSVQYIDKDDARILEIINKASLSHVRSVLLCRGSLVPHFMYFKYIRVLRLEDQGLGGDIDLTGISSLFLLRYLKFANLDGSNYHLKLPNQIGDLQQLETIDLAGFLENFPSDIVSLALLSHLSSRRNKAGGIVLPDGIERLKSLHTLVGVVISNKSSVESIMGLGKLTNLRKLHICLNENVHTDALHSSLSMLSANLRILTFGKGWPIGLDDVSCWGRTLFPRGCHIRELDLGCCEFQRCPKWIGQLDGLTKLMIWVREVADGVNIVAGLPSLSCFWLIVSMFQGEKEESVVIPGGGAFKALKHLRFHCKKASLTFEAGAMPMLEELSIQLRYHMSGQLLPVGIEHLPAGTLNKIWLRVYLDDRWEVEGSQGWDDDDWDNYFSSHEFRQGRDSVRQLVKVAFERHHPDADIILSLHNDYRNE
ncbi:hypothetical protein VPH35_070702 [Triticum aestivum]